MAFRGNTDSTGSNPGTAVYSATADITALNAGAPATFAHAKLGLRVLDQQAVHTYVLISTAGVRSLLLVTPP